MATEQQVTLAVRYFPSLDDPLQQQMVGRAIDALEFPSPQRSALLKELDRLAELMRPLDQDLETELAKRQQDPAGALRFVLRNIPIWILIQDVVWPQLKKLMESCSGFCWGTPSFEDPRFFWPQTINSATDVARLDALWLKESEEPAVSVEEPVVGSVEPPEPVEERMEGIAEEPAEEIKSVQSSKRKHKEEPNPKAKRPRTPGLSYQVEGEAPQVGPHIVIDGQTFLEMNCSKDMVACLQRGNRITEFRNFGVYHIMRMPRGKALRVQVF